jgi:hypothetical protein
MVGVRGFEPLPLTAGDNNNQLPGVLAVSIQRFLTLQALQETPTTSIRSPGAEYISIIIDDLLHFNMNLS